MNIPFFILNGKENVIKMNLFNIKIKKCFLDRSVKLQQLGLIS